MSKDILKKKTLVLDALHMKTTTTCNKVTDTCTFDCFRQLALMCCDKFKQDLVLMGKPNGITEEKFYE
jgi:hypothetical protein